MRSTAHALRKMSFAKLSIVAFVTLALLTTVFLMTMGKSLAAPSSPTDESKVPHYFGPNPNWALSPLTLPAATVTIDPPGGVGTTAQATATVGANGAVTGITITDPGSGYATAPNVTITGPAGATGATATASVTAGGAVTGVTISDGGKGYTKPVVTFSGGGATTQATGTAYGAVDAVTLTAAGSGYTFPTVDFDMPDDPNGVQATGHVVCADQAGGTIPCPTDGTPMTLQGVVVDNAGSGYATAPGVAIHDGTLMAPINNAGAGATATATITIQSVVLDTFGTGYSSPPQVDITDAGGTPLAPAVAAATIDTGAVSAINLLTGGSGYVTPGGIKKFTDALPALCDPSVRPLGTAPGSCPDWTATPAAKAIPLAVAANKVYTEADGTKIAADQYEIAVVQYRTNFSSSLKDPATGQPLGTLVRGYVQLETPDNAGISQHYPLTNASLDPNVAPTPIMINGVQAYGVTPPQWLGPIIAATKNKPVRIVFHNLLPTGSEGDLFLPTDSTLMGSGMGPMPMGMPNDQQSVMDEVRNPGCSEYPKSIDCFKDDRATLHLHGGITPWISDGTPHQWITPANENTPWPKGVSVTNVPDMWFDAQGNSVPAGTAGATNDPGPGVQTFFYTNQQSARLLFYHDHSWGITRLNVYAGEAAGYLISDATEQGLISKGTIPGPADSIPLIVQDRTFVPSDAQLYNQIDANGNIVSYGQDPTWDKQRWGGMGSFWYHHVYMPAQNPGDPSGMSAYGRWMYGPWFWPPAAGTVHGPIPNPYYGMDPKGTDGIRGTGDDWLTPLAKPCDLNDPTSWQYQTDPFCEPAVIPGTPNISVGMEQFNDTPIVNGVAYPTITLQPKTYRLRMLNAANDRFFNFQWYVADPNTASTDLNQAGQPIGGTEVALDPQLLAAAQTDPNVFPTPVQGTATAGPDWVQIGTEGGFLPAPAVVDGQQPTTWITDPTRFDFGNVDQHSLLLAPAERADVIVDFSKYAGQTLILYNDAPAAFPARIASYDYYTGAPDLSPNGAPAILPGYGPNTRTIMQVKIAGTAAPAFNLTALKSAFNHKADGSGVFESGQHPIIVGQAAYKSAYGITFGFDGFVRVNDTSSFSFNTLKSPTTKVTIPLQPKAIHDEMNATTFDEFGRMQANLGVEAQPPSPGQQNVTLYPYVNPTTELIDGTNLPKAGVTYDATTGLPVSDIKMTPVSADAGGNIVDGTQLWRITHNGVDTHPIHFHLYDVQIVNRVTWDNIIIPPDASELGWKDTIRVSPLEDTIVALRPLVPQVPFELPNSIRVLSPMLPKDDVGSTMFNPIDPQGNGTAAIVNKLVNFGWEYVYHCHILSHEEMDMMRPVDLVLPPNKADTLAFDVPTKTLTWMDNSINETSFSVERSTDGGTTWAALPDAASLQSPLDQANVHETRSYVDATYDPGATTGYQYRVVASNTVGYGSGFPTVTATSTSAAFTVGPQVPAAPSGLTATLNAGSGAIDLQWVDNATNETGFYLERATNGAGFVRIATLPADSTMYSDAAVSAGDAYQYRVQAYNGTGNSPYSNVASIVLAPPAPTSFTGILAGFPTLVAPQVSLSWSETSAQLNGFLLERSVNGAAFAPIATPASASRSYIDTSVQAGNTYAYRIAATNAGGTSPYATTTTFIVPGLPTAPSQVGVSASVKAAAKGGGSTGTATLTVTWTDNAANEAGYQIWVSTSVNFTNPILVQVTANSTRASIGNLARRTNYYVEVRAFNIGGPSAWVQANPFPVRTP